MKLYTSKSQGYWIVISTFFFILSFIPIILLMYFINSLFASLFVITAIFYILILVSLYDEDRSKFKEKLLSPSKKWKVVKDGDRYRIIFKKFFLWRMFGEDYKWFGFETPEEANIEYKKCFNNRKYAGYELIYEGKIK